MISPRSALWLAMQYLGKFGSKISSLFVRAPIALAVVLAVAGAACFVAFNPLIGCTVLSLPELWLDADEGTGIGTTARVCDTQ